MKGIVYVCPSCGDKMELFVTAKGIWCSNKHPSVTMLPKQKARPVGRASA